MQETSVLVVHSRDKTKRVVVNVMVHATHALMQFPAQVVSQISELD